MQNKIGLENQTYENQRFEGLDISQEKVKCHLLGVQWQDFLSAGLIAAPLHPLKAAVCAIIA